MSIDAQPVVFVAGHRGLVGSAIVRALERRGTSPLTVPRGQLDLSDAQDVQRFFDEKHPQQVFLAAARVGGIEANRTAPVEFLGENLRIQDAVLRAAHRAGVDKLLFLGSSCIYPKHAAQPIREDALLSGKLEPTNQAYAIAKIAGLVACESYNREYGTNFIAAMPTNLYGPGDNFDLTTSHVLPAMIRKFHDAKRTGAASVTLWGSGTPRRELLFVDDLAEACLHLMDRFDAVDAEPCFVNVGSGEDLTIANLAERVSRCVGFEGQIVWDRGKPDGTPRKLLDVSRIRALGWTPRVGLDEGIQVTYDWYLKRSTLTVVD